MNINNSIFPEENEEFPWDENIVQAFKTLIRDEGIQCCMDDIFLLGILRARNFEMPASISLLKNYYDTRLDYRHYSTNLLPSKLEHVLSMKCMQFLPKPDQKGRYIFIIQISKWNTSIANAVDMLRTLMIFFDFQLNFHRTQVNNIVFILNAAGLSFSHFFQISPRLISSGVNIMFKESSQIQYSEMHFVNMNIFMKALLNIFVPLLPQELRKRLHFHSGVTTLHEFVSPECLPLEFGGNLPSFDSNECNNMIKANEEFFRQNEEYLKLYEEGIKKSSKK